MSERIILVPGILGTKLTREQRLIWPHPFRLSELAYHPGARDDRTVPTEIIGRFFQDFYSELIKHLEREEMVGSHRTPGYRVITCPYDWRLPIEHESLRLRDLIQAQQGDVTIVAHSMGGLLAKHCLTEYPGIASQVRYLFTIGTPWLGAPDALDFLESDLKLSWLFFPGARRAGVTFPSVYQLVPSPGYFLPKPSGSVPYPQVREAANGRSPDRSYFECYNTNGVQTWLSRTLPANVTHCSVAGTGLRTGESIELIRGACRSVKSDAAGDGRVPHRSAMWGQTQHRTIQRFVKHLHGTLCSARPVWQWVKYTLATGRPEEATIEGLLTQPLGYATGEMLLVKCPVDLFVVGEPPHLAGILGEYVVNAMPDTTVEPHGANGKLVRMPLETHPVYLRATTEGSMVVRHLAHRERESVLTIYPQVSVAYGTTGEVEHGSLTVLDEGGQAEQIRPLVRIELPADQADQLEAMFFDFEGPRISFRFNGVKLTSDRSHYIRTKEETAEVRVETEGISQVTATHWKEADRPKWYPYNAPILCQANKLHQIAVRATDRIGNQRESVLTLGFGSAPPRCSHLALKQAEMGNNLHTTPVSLRFQTEPHWAPIQCIWITVNGHSKYRHNPEDPFVFAEDGEYRVTYWAEDAAGIEGPAQQIEPFTLVIDARQEAAAGTELAVALRDRLPELQHLEIVAVEIDGKTLGLSQPLPLVVEDCVVTLRRPESASPDEQGEFQYPVALSTTVNWLKPGIQDAIFTRSDQIIARFQVVLGSRPIAQAGRVSALLLRSDGREEPLPVEEIPELLAGRVQVSCAPLPSGNYQLRLMTKGTVLGSQVFRII